MRNRLRPFLVAGVSVGALLVLAFDLSSQIPLPYLVWTAGNPATDQSTTVNPMDPKKGPCHSGLASWMGAGDVLDTQFASLMAPYVQNGVYLFTAFMECFGDGMFDELNALGGMQSGVSAALHDQLATYPLAVYNKAANKVKYTGNGPNPGVYGGGDFVYAFNRSMLLPVVASENMALWAATNDPWGQSAATYPVRMGETQFEEQPVYFFSKAAAMTQPLAPRPENALVFLWSGIPNLIDQAQVAQMIQYLRLLGYPPSSIYAFYGFGSLPKTNPIVTAFGNQTANFLKDHIRQANSTQLDLFFNLKVNKNFIFNRNPAYIAFFATDHGLNTCANPMVAAKIQVGNPIPPIPVDEGTYPSGTGGVGGDDSSDPPSM
jgi:hypothetical protein